MAKPMFHFGGISQVAGTLFIAARKFPKETRRALMQEMRIEREEVRKRTPKDTGTLRRSIHLVGPDEASDQIYASIVAGSDLVNPKTGKMAAEYAAIVHEDLNVHHRIGQAKYLESVLNESAPYIPRRVARRIDLNKVLN